MSAFKKLFLAAALVGAGLGVAYLLGEPTALQRVLPNPGQYRVAIQGPTLLSKPAPAAGCMSGVRLLPETTSDHPAPSSAVAPPVPSPSPQLTSISAAPILTHVESSTLPVGVTTAVNSSALQAADDFPRARLRSEAPRPIGNEPRSPATIRRAPVVEPDSTHGVTNDVANTIPAAWSATPQLLPIGYETSGPAAVTTNAAYTDIVNPINQSADTSMPWPPDDADDPRTHIIVDGDSLQKLAGRYLNDPNRSGEIFELNRELLSNPDLLPIGVELKIPDRTQQASWNRESQRHETLESASVREASRLTPLRPISQDANIAPRARLTAPCAID